MTRDRTRDFSPRPRYSANVGALLTSRVRSSARAAAPGGGAHRRALHGRGLHLRLVVHRSQTMIEPHQPWHFLLMNAAVRCTLSFSNLNLSKIEGSPLAHLSKFSHRATNSSINSPLSSGCFVTHVGIDLDVLCPPAEILRETGL